MKRVSIIILATVLSILGCFGNGSVLGRLPDVIQTKAGPIQGLKTIGYSGKPVNTYYGVPYAEPPVGNLRFSPPLKLPLWEETFHADQKPCPCYQNIGPKVEEILSSDNMMIDKPWCEDCLKLNIWVPDASVDSPKPVLVYLHGGNFQIGSSVHHFSEGATIAAEENVIVVSVNYRLNVFGFLKLNMPETPGNLGLLDQQLALQWVKENIGSFGGSTENITLYGADAGAASAGFHIISPKSRGLFQRAFLISGVPNNPWAFRDTNDIMKLSVSFSTALNCSSKIHTEVLECLKALNPDEIVGALQEELTTDTSLYFGPTVDDNLITERPSSSLAAGRFNDVDLVVGSTTGEGRLAATIATLDLIKKNVSFTLGVLEQGLRNTMPHMIAKEEEVLKSFYVDLNFAKEPLELKEELANILADVIFVCGSNEFAYRYSLSGHPVYRYVLDQPFPHKNVQYWGGTDHGTDLLYFSGLPLMSQLPNEIAVSSSTENRQAAELSRRMMRYLGNFARTGDPNISNMEQPRWPRYTVSSRKHLVIALNFTIGLGFRSSECAFLDQVFPQLRYQRTTNRCSTVPR